MTSSGSRLLKMIAAPSKVARVLDWRRGAAGGGSVLNIDIHSDRVDLALGYHPSEQEEASRLDPIRLLPKGKLPEGAREELSKIVDEQNVLAFVVSWPVQQDTGRLGAACGRVFHTLEELIVSEHESLESSKDDGDSATAIFNSNRPLCLWDSHRSGNNWNMKEQDPWGRDTAYGSQSYDDDEDKTSNKNYIHSASTEQYHQNANVVATQVWNDFMQTHWPQLNHR